MGRGRPCKDSLGANGGCLARTGGEGVWWQASAGLHVAGFRGYGPDQRSIARGLLLLTGKKGKGAYTAAGPPSGTVIRRRYFTYAVPITGGIGALSVVCPSLSAGAGAAESQQPGSPQPGSRQVGTHL